MNSRVTMVIPEILASRVLEHHKENNPTETLSSFYTRALVNQLEKEGDFEIREILENAKEEND